MTIENMPQPWLTNLQQQHQQEEDQHESICLHCMLLEMQQSNENLATEVYELKGAVEKLLKVINR